MSASPVVGPSFVAPGSATVHASSHDDGLGLAWCGIRRQFRHRNTDAPVTCRRCLLGIERGRGFAHGSR